MTLRDDPLNRLALNQECPYCGALVGMWCVTYNGFATVQLHEGRLWMLRDAWRIGWEAAVECYDLRKRVAS